MNILVCIKQVPDTTEIKIDPVKNTLIREGVPAIVNPFDGYALEAAARIKDQHPDTKIVALSMGIPAAKKALKECLSIAADKAYLVSGRPFGGSDTLATSYIISNAIRRVEQEEGPFDAIFCGKQAIDGDTAQVGPEIAEHLGYPQVTCALEASLEDTMLKVRKEEENGSLLIGVALPCVVTFTKPSWEPRYPTVRRILDANRTEIPTISDLDIPEIDTSRIGLKGSPTRVKQTFVPQKKQGGVKLAGMPAGTAAKELYGRLAQAGVL